MGPYRASTQPLVPALCEPSRLGGCRTWAGWCCGVVESQGLLYSSGCVLDGTHLQAKLLNCSRPVAFCGQLRVSVETFPVACGRK